MATFYLVRHAHTDWTPDENRPVSAQGSRGAIRVADMLQAYPVDVIFSSPATRARQTIAPFAERHRMQVRIEPDLRERVLGQEKFEDFFGAVEATWRDPSFSHPGGESSTEAQQRGLAVVKRLQAKHPNEAIVLSTHGNLMALILLGFDPTVDFDFWKSLTMPDVYKLSISLSGEIDIYRIWHNST